MMDMKMRLFYSLKNWNSIYRMKLSSNKKRNIYQTQNAKER